MMLLFVKTLMVGAFLLMQIGFVQARPTGDYKVLVDLLKNNQTTAFKDALKRQTKSGINAQGKANLVGLAISQNRANSIGALLDWGIDVNHPLAFEVGGEVFNVTPLIYAISSKASLETVELLVRRGADVNKASGTSLPLNSSIAWRQYATANYLIDRGGDVNATTLCGVCYTPLMELSFYAEPDIAAMKALFEKLVHRGAKINTKTANGTSALWLAVYLGKIQLVESLLEAGAEPNTVNGKGQSVLAVAKQKQRDDVATTLIRYGAKS
jgi:ankyrin repeat protein